MWTHGSFPASSARTIPHAAFSAVFVDSTSNKQIRLVHCGITYNNAEASITPNLRIPPQSTYASGRGCSVDAISTRLAVLSASPPNTIAVVIVEVLNVLDTVAGDAAAVVPP